MAPVSSEGWGLSKEVVKQFCEWWYAVAKEEEGGRGRSGSSLSSRVGGRGKVHKSLPDKVTIAET